MTEIEILRRELNDALDKISALKTELEIRDAELKMARLCLGIMQKLVEGRENKYEDY